MSVGTGENVIARPREGSRRPPAKPSARPAFIGRIRAGGTDGNERLTTVTGMILLVQLAVIGVTIVDLRQLVWLHLFVGMMLLGPVALKLSSVGYKFIRYYTGNPAYRRQGPPVLVLRLLGPMVLLSTLAVLATGGILLLVGPGHSYPWLLLHKATFIVWVAFMTLHVIGHLPGVARTLGVVRKQSEPRAGAASGSIGRWLVVTCGLLGGLILALVLVPEFSAWTGTGVVHHALHIR